MIQVIASGSSGNCTIYDKKILLDAGIQFERIQRALNFESPQAALITHEHCDHANKKTIAELLKRGTEIYMTAGTAAALNLEKSHRLHLIESGKTYTLGDLKFMALPTIHDAAEPVAFLVNDVAYITDTSEIPNLPTPKILLIETNYSTEKLLSANIDEFQKQRILKNHLSLEKVAAYLQTQPQLQEVHLVHLSRRNANAELFKSTIQAIVGDKVFTH